MCKQSVQKRKGWEERGLGGNVRIGIIEGVDFGKKKEKKEKTKLINNYFVTIETHKRGCGCVQLDRKPTSSY